MKIRAIQIQSQLYIILGIYSNKATMYFYVKSLGRRNRQWSSSTIVASCVFVMCNSFMVAKASMLS
jgi:hypothetical protein